MCAPKFLAAFRWVRRGSLAKVSCGPNGDGEGEGSASAEGGIFSLPHTSMATLRRLFCVRLSTSSQDFLVSPNVTTVSRGRFVGVTG